MAHGPPRTFVRVQTVVRVWAVTLAAGGGAALAEWAARLAMRARSGPGTSPDAVPWAVPLWAAMVAVGLAVYVLAGRYVETEGAEPYDRPDGGRAAVPGAR